MRRAVWLAAGAALVIAACSQEPEPRVAAYDDVDELAGIGDLTHYLEKKRRKHDLPALAAAVVNRDGIVAIGVAGERRRGSGIPVTLEDQFHIGSCTKSMTATLLGTLVEDGQLNWEQSLAELLPDLAAEMHPLWQKATLRQLLTNRAGAPASITKMDPELWSRFMRHEDDPQQQRDLLLRAVLAREPASQPGSTYLYSNAGFSMAGTVAEQIAGLPFEELMRTRLFEPLAMTSAGFGAPGEPGKMDQPWGHSANGKPVPPGRNADNPPAISPAGRVHLTLSDWARYIQIHLRGAAGDTDLLSQVTFRELHRPPANAEPAYAMGWDITDEAGPEVRVLVHNGSNTMWFAMAWVALERDLGVIVVTNQGDQDDAVDDTLWNLVVDAVERR